VLHANDEPALIGVSLDRYGILRYGDRWVALSKAEQAVMSMLLSAFGGVVARDALERSVWPDREPERSRRSIHVVVFRLRKRIAPLGLAISTIRSEGFLMHWTDD
jgi:DNA-binding response OmpR family regulator